MMIDFIRHGDTGRQGHLDGRTDHPLTPEGWAQFQRQTQPTIWKRVMTSPLQRTRAAAEALAATNSADVFIDADWSEMDFGAWDGQTWAALQADAKQSRALAAFYADPDANPPPGGETGALFQARIAHGLRQLIASDNLDPVLVVTHGGPIRAVLSQACGVPHQSTWAVRIGHATRLRLEVGLADGKLWGQILELTQP